MKNLRTKVILTNIFLFNDLFLELKDNVVNDLSQYSREGLRTLVMAMRQVPEHEYTQFNKLYNKLANSNSPYKDKKITELYVKMENKLRYLGCTAIEDKLQDVSFNYNFYHKFIGCTCYNRNAY